MTHAEVGEAYFSDDKRYRYALSRVWDYEKPMLLFIGLNPSTADETKLDPTLRRVIRFAEREDCGGIWVGNLFSFRATQPRDMLRHPDPVGPETDTWLASMAQWCKGHVIAGWGAHGGHRGRDEAVRRVLTGYEVKCLGLTRDGQPRHPLYLPRNAPLIVYQSGMWRPGVAA